MTLKMLVWEVSSQLGICFSVTTWGTQTPKGDAPEFQIHFHHESLGECKGFVSGSHVETI